MQVDFVQEKKMAIFSAPIVLRGCSLGQWILLPGTLFHLLNMPLSCDKGCPSVGWEHNVVQEFKMSSNPIMRVASQQLQRWFSGNYEKLATEYDVSLISRQPLILTCVPHKDSRSSSLLHVSLSNFVKICDISIRLQLKRFPASNKHPVREFSS